MHVPPADTVSPDTQVPPLIVKALPVGPAVLTATVGAAVSVKPPGLAEVALLVSVMVPLCAVVAPFTRVGANVEKLTVATVVVPVSATV